MNGELRCCGVQAKPTQEGAVAPTPKPLVPCGVGRCSSLWGAGYAPHKALASLLGVPARSRLHPLRSAFHASLRSQHKSLGAYGHGLPATHHRHRAASLQLSMTSEVKSKSG